MSAVATSEKPTRARGMPVVVVASICWVYLLAQALAPAAPELIAEAGPGMEALAALKALAPGDSIAALLNASLCQPADVQWSAGDFADAFAMWIAMVVAMLLPEARRVPVSRGGSSLPYLAGYVIAWAPYCGVATFVQRLLRQQGYLDERLVSTSMALNIVVVTLAIGSYLLLRPARSKASRVPGSVAGASGLGAGLSYGLSKMRCGAPLMLLMFIVGVMNVVAMAAFMAVMCLESKIRDGLRRVQQPAEYR